MPSGGSEPCRSYYLRGRREGAGSGETAASHPSVGGRHESGKAILCLGKDEVEQKSRQVGNSNHNAGGCAATAVSLANEPINAARRARMPAPRNARTNKALLNPLSSGGNSCH